MGKDLIHIKASSSWWNGTVTTLCGATFDSSQVERVWLSSTTCPTCKRLKRGGK